MESCGFAAFEDGRSLPVSLLSLLEALRSTDLVRVRWPALAALWRVEIDDLAVLDDDHSVPFAVWAGGSAPESPAAPAGSAVEDLDSAEGWCLLVDHRRLAFWRWKAA